MRLDDRTTVFLRGLRCAAWLPAMLLLLAGCHGVVSQSKNSEGTKLFAQGQSEAAQKRFLEAVANDPSDPDGYYNLAVLAHYNGRQKKNRNDLAMAEQLYNQCLDRAPDHVPCHRGLAVLLVEEERKDKAFTLLQRWGQRNPGSADAKVELARLYDEFGESATAKQALQDALVLEPKNPRALAALGSLHERQGDYAQALAVYQRSLQANSNQPELAQRVAGLQRGPTSPPPTGVTGAPPAAATPIAPPAGSAVPPAAPIAPPVGTPPAGTPPAGTPPAAPNADNPRMVGNPPPARG